MKDHFQEMGWDWSQYYVFTTIRNPWERVVSHFHHGSWDDKLTPRWEPANYNPNTRCSFEEFIRVKSKKNNMWPLIPHNEFAYDKLGNNLVHECFLLEEIDTKLPPILDRIGIANYKIYHINTSKHTHYSEYYTPETRDLISAMFAFDIKTFGFVYEDQAADRRKEYAQKSSKVKI